MATLQSKLILSLQDQVTGRMRAISAQVAAFQGRMRGMVAPFTGMAARIAGMAAGYVGVTQGLRGTVGAAINFESAFADVRKVVDATDEQYANFAQTIKNMSRELPLTSVEIAQLWAAAGESGIANEELKSFSEMAARVGIAFDMSAGEAGDSLAKLKAQLGMNVEETGLMADAINHLSNNMASKASQITAYMLRVGKFAEMGGFHRDQIAAIGSAMISAGAQAEQAGTAMMNVVRKMTTGEYAKKDQRDAAKALGLDLPTIAKQMKKDAPKALKTVLKAIAKAPEEKQIALLSKFFGDEARAFAPLVGNIELLDKALDSVADRTKYAGSAYQEYVARASTTANALQILRNKIAYVFEDMGARWLPTIKEGVAAIGGVLDTLGERASVFDELGAAFSGFTSGLGYQGGLREVIEDLGDLLFGKADPSGAGEQLGRVFMKFKEWGKAVRELSDAIRDNPIAQFIGELAGYGFKLMLATVGFTLLAGAVMKLGRALMFLSGASAAIAILKTLAGIGGAVFGAAGKAGGVAGAAGKGAAGGAAAAGAGGFWKQILSRVPQIALAAGAAYGTGRILNELSADTNAENRRAATHRGAEHDGMEAWRSYRDSGNYADDMASRKGSSSGGFWNSPFMEDVRGIFSGIKAWDAGMAERTGLKANPGTQQDPTPTLQQILGAVHQPSGTQNVNVMNPTPVHAPVNVTVYATTNADANQIAAQVGAKVQDTIAGYYGTSAYG